MKSKKNIKKPEGIINTGISLSDHSRKRAQQRGITENLIRLAMDYSVAIFKQGHIFYVVIEKLMPEHLAPRIWEKLNNLVIVASQETGEVITCYKRRHALHYINKKPKRLAVDSIHPSPRQSGRSSAAFPHQFRAPRMLTQLSQNQLN